MCGFSYCTTVQCYCTVANHDETKVSNLGTLIRYIINLDYDYELENLTTQQHVPKYAQMCICTTGNQDQWGNWANTSS